MPEAIAPLPLDFAYWTSLAVAAFDLERADRATRTTTVRPRVAAVLTLVAMTLMSPLATILAESATTEYKTWVG